MEWTPEEIRRLRRGRGLSQEELAARLGVSRSIINKWETGERRPGAASVRKLRNVLIDAPDTAATGVLAAATDMQMIREFARRLDEHTPPGQKAADMQLVSDIARRLALRGELALPEHGLDWPRTEPGEADEHGA